MISFEIIFIYGNRNKIPSLYKLNRIIKRKPIMTNIVKNVDMIFADVYMLNSNS